MQHLKRVFVVWWPSMLTLCVVLWLTLVRNPLPDTEFTYAWFEHSDKVVHYIMMGGLTGAVIFDRMRQTRHAPSVIFMVIIFVAVALFSALDEWAQQAMHNGRTADAYDFIADVAGSFTALLAAPPVVKLILKKQ